MSLMEDNRLFVSQLIDAAIKSVNIGISRKLTARRGEETPPNDTRHLTDTRTRVSTLLEYAVAYEMNNRIESLKKGHSISAVLWNVFPDLLIRDEKRIPYIGMEIKALHTAAEEKSANLDTPLYIIDKDRDFVVVLVWTWFTEHENGHDLVFPKILDHAVINAYLLAQMRDYTWLNNNKGRRKAIDIGTPMISPDGEKSSDLYKSEEGNMGKLMRISFDANMPKSVPNYKMLVSESNAFHSFQDRVVMTAILDIASELARRLNRKFEVVGDAAKAKMPEKLALIARAISKEGASIGFLAGSNGKTWPQEAAEHDSVMILGTKLNWELHIKKGKADYKKVKDGLKVESCFADIIESHQ